MIHDDKKQKPALTSEEAVAATPAAPNGAGDDAERKERVLHTRVPESLDDAIRAAASELGMSVSNLVRNVLANALDVVEAATLRVPRRAAAAAASVRGADGPSGEAAAASAPEPAAEPATPARVLGWQEATLELNAICDRCNAILARGARAAISIPERGSAPRTVRCLPCLEELTRDPAR